jgi:hypothetical protein
MAKFAPAFFVKEALSLTQLPVYDRDWMPMFVAESVPEES